MAAPTRPVLPAAPRSSEPSTFQDRADGVIAFLTTLVDYIAESNGFTQEQAESDAGGCHHKQHPSRHPELDCWRPHSRQCRRGCH